MSEIPHQPKSPVVEVISTKNIRYEMTWNNTLVRLFLDAQYEHIEFTQNGQTYGLKVPHEVVTQLLEMFFPHRYDPYPDSTTFEWYVKSSMKEMEAELKEI